mmetsp:Transcript_23465/g.67007  ORF Transcript_23465/g.67007 Transcript_23465/m.67007 type:complete len:240 (-) Transcript_23465:141-860(-)
MEPAEACSWQSLGDASPAKSQVGVCSSGEREPQPGRWRAAARTALAGLALACLAALLPLLCVALDRTVGMPPLNASLASAVLGILFAQLAKPLTHLATHGVFRLSRAWGSGGMPSSHTACVVGLVTSVGVNSGWRSDEFAMAAVLAAIVMYDACHVRLRAGHHAAVLNQLAANLPEGHQVRVTLEDLSPKKKAWLSRDTINQPSLLETNLGHQKPEVLGGIVVGIAVGLAGAHAFRSPN